MKCECRSLTLRYASFRVTATKMPRTESLSGTASLDQWPSVRKRRDRDLAVELYPWALPQQPELESARMRHLRVGIGSWLLLWFATANLAADATYHEEISKWRQDFAMDVNARRGRG